jgi:tRNA modification GTPase
MDIINSKSAAALQIAVQQQEGFLSKKLKEVRKKLRDVIVHLEAVIDYPEEDIEDVTYNEVKNSISEAAEEVSVLLEGAHTGKILKEGLRTAIIGRPNVGKSSLLNTLLKEDRALVSEYEGTTRDVIEEQLVIGGVPVLLADTAGIHDTKDFVEKLGVERSRAFLDKAELILVVLDGTQPLTSDDETILAAIKGKNAVFVVNKTDLSESIITKTLAERFAPENIIEISAKTKEGIDRLESWLKEYVYGSSRQSEEEIYIQNERQINLLRQAADSLKDALEAAENRLPYDCLTIDVDRALTLMGEITGETVRDEIINEIFARFCVGK